MPPAAISGPAPMKTRGPWRSASAPKRRESANITIVTGSVVSPLFERAVARDLLQVDDEEEEEDPEPGVHAERLEVADGEVAPREQLELQHRLGRAPLVGEERRERDDAADERDEDHRAAPAVVRLLDQREHDPAQPERAQAGTDEVDLALRRRAVARGTAARIRSSVARTSGTLSAKIQRQDTLVDDQPSRERADDRRDPAPGRPRPDRGAALAPDRTRRR